MIAPVMPCSPPGFQGVIVSMRVNSPGTGEEEGEKLGWFDQYQLAFCPLFSPLQSEYHYEYTACDSTSSRWRVAVPHTPGLCTSLPDPVRGTECCKQPSCSRPPDTQL